MCRQGQCLRAEHRGYLRTYAEEQELSTKPPLYRLDKMYASNFLCNKILPIKSDSNDYWVPCVHSCTPKEHVKKSCPFLVGLGHVVLDKNRKLIGLVSWNCDKDGQNVLPVGMAVPNSVEFFLDLRCAAMIRFRLLKKENWMVKDCHKHVYFNTSDTGYEFKPNDK